MWCPPSYKLVYNPINYIDISTISPSEIRVINQLSYLGGTTLYRHFMTFPNPPREQNQRLPWILVMFGGSMLHCVLHQQLNRLLFVWGLHVKLSEPAEIQIIVSTRDRGGYHPTWNSCYLLGPRWVYHV